MAIVALVFGVLLEQVVLAQSAFKLTRIRTKLVAAEARHEELLLEAAKLESPGRVERYAREVLGMVDPADVEYVVADVVAPRDAVARVPRPGGPVLPPGDASAAATWAEPEGP